MNGLKDGLKDGLGAKRLDEVKLITILNGTFNRHWSTGKIDLNRAPLYKRRDFYTLKNELNNKFVTILTGPRQVGKTTLIYQLMDNLITRKENPVKPERILYVEMDDTAIQSITEEPISDVLDVYSRMFLKEPLEKLTSTVYVFLDEIQYTENWAHKIKSIYDRNYKIKFFLSGSSSVEIKVASNPLQGRMIKKVVTTLKFSDFAAFHLQNKRDNIIKFSTQVRDSIKEAIENGKAEDLYNTIIKNKVLIADIERDLEIKFYEYLIRGGYPGLLSLNLSEASNLLKNSLELSILDITKRYNIKHPAYFNKILYLLSDSSSQNVNYSGISKDIGIDKITVTDYIEYLKDTYIVSICSFFSTGPAKVRKDYKIHLNDVGLRNSIVGLFNEKVLGDRSELGKIIETCTFNHAQRLQFFLSDHESIDLAYTVIGKREIDIIINYKKYTLPIEVKLDGTRAENEVALKEFMEKYKLKLGLIVTDKTLKLHDNLLLIPAWMFALCC